MCGILFRMPVRDKFSSEKPSKTGILVVLITHSSFFLKGTSSFFRLYGSQVNTIWLVSKHHIVAGHRIYLFFIFKFSHQPKFVKLAFFIRWKEWIKPCVWEHETIDFLYYLIHYMTEAFLTFQRTMLQWKMNNGATAGEQCFKWPWTMVRCPMNHACVFDLTHMEFPCIN